ncbi:hypothetical protein EBT31_09640 [bacterium]|nr:hypothetical protein [bacterium]
MRADGFNASSVDRLVGEAKDYIDANSDVAGKVVLVRSLQLAIDHLGNEAAILALRWKNRTIADVGDVGQLARQLVAAYDELSRVYVPYMTLGRQPAQEMRGRQMKNPFDGGLMAMPKGVILRHGTSRQAAESIVETGFQAGDKASNLLGSGVYFTTNPRYTSAYGDTEIFGDLPEDVLILDLIEMGKSVNDVAKEIGIGSIKVTRVDGEPFHFMSGKQKDLFRAWVLDQGYDGVRYDSSFTSKGIKGPRSVDEVVVYDVNKANRVVGSKAAVEAPPVDDINVPSVIAKEMSVDVENLMDKFPAKAQAEIMMGELSDETEQMLEVLADGIQAQKNAGKYAAGSFAEKVRKARPGSLTLDAVTQFYISSLIWSDATWYAMLLGSSYKAATLPLVQATGYYWHSIGDLAKLDAKSAVRNYRRGNQQWAMYTDYQLRLGAAWKLMKMSFDAGTPINSTMRGLSDYSTPERLADQQAAARMAGSDESATVALRENTLDNPFFLDPDSNYLSPETFNPLAAAIRFVWKTNNMSQRVAASIDTVLSHIVVPATEYRRFFVEELERAEEMGLKHGSQEALEFATKRAQARLDEISRDVYMNGETVKNGVITGTAAENVTNWLNFTDDVWISEQEMRLQRTYEGGLRVAKERGIEDPGQANDFAVNWANETPNIPGAGRVASVVPKLWENAVTMMPILRLQQAFNRTPANMLKSAARGVPGANLLVDTYWRDLQSENPDIRARASGELVVGSTIAGVLFSAAVAGHVQFAGAGPSDPAQNRKWRTYLGLDTGPFSMRVKNPVSGQWYPWVSIQRLDQIGTIAGAIGDYIDLGNSMTIEDANSLGGSIGIAIATMLFRTVKGQLDRTTYQGFKELVEAAQGLVMPLDMEGDRINPAVGMVENILAKLVTPYGGAIRLAKRNIDPRRTSVPASNFLQETFDRIRSQYPGQTADLPSQLHPVTGDEQMSAGIWGTQFIPPNMPWLKGLVAMVSPTSVFPYAESTNDPVDAELAKLQGRGARFDFWPPTVVEGYRLGYRERNDFVRIGTTIIPPGMDTTFYEALRQTIASQAYQDASDQRPSKLTESDRAIMINDVYRVYKEAALQEFLASPSGAAAKEAYDRLDQSRIDQRNRLGGVMATERPALLQGGGGVAEFVQGINR